MIEAGVIVGLDGQPLFWHLPPGRTAVWIPDTRVLWDMFWEHRDSIAGFAHSHPGSGVPGPSHTDLTTFAAVEAALGRRLAWWITSETHVILVLPPGSTLDRIYTEGRYNFTTTILTEAPSWAAELRRLSAQEQFDERADELGGSHPR